MRILSPFVIATVMFLAMSASGCAPIDSHGEFLSTAPFARMRTFSFAPPEGPPSGYQTSARSARVTEQMKALVSEALETKGYVRAPQGEGDIIIACGAGRREVDEQVRMPLPRQVTAITGEQDEDRDFIEGGIVINAFDRAGGQIWHGEAHTEIDPQLPNRERLRKTVHAALERFPSHPGARWRGP